MIGTVINRVWHTDHEHKVPLLRPRATRTTLHNYTNHLTTPPNNIRRPYWVKLVRNAHYMGYHLPDLKPNSG